MVDAANNQTTQSSQKESGVDIASNKYVWIAGGIILLIAGWFGFQAIMGTSDNYKLSLVDAPKEVTVGGVATFTWRIDGPGTQIHSTAVRLGTESQSGDLDAKVKPEDTKYTMFVKDFTNGDFNIPLQFVGNIPLTALGKYYFRVHALIKDKNLWSDEYSLDVKPLAPKVTVIDGPKVVEAGKVFTFTWRVDGPPATINHTAIYFGTESTPGTLGTDIAPAGTKYNEYIRDFASGKFNVPLQFVGNAKIATPGAYFYRGEAIVDDANYWTDEYTLEVKPAAEKQAVSPAAKVTVTPTVAPTEAPTVTPTPAL
jgi:hypothetical protein